MKQTNVEVNRETVIKNIVVRDGSKVFNIGRNPKGVVISVGKQSVTIPNGEAGDVLLAELGVLRGTATVKAKRTRRTKAEIERAENEAAKVIGGAPETA